MEAQLHQTREAWLNYIAERMAPVFEKLGAPLPAQLRIAIGFTSSGRRSRRIGVNAELTCHFFADADVPRLTNSLFLAPDTNRWLRREATRCLRWTI